MQDNHRTYIRRNEEDEHFSARWVRPDFRCKLVAHVVADARDEAILDWLSPLNMYQKQQDTISTRRGTTGSWLLRDPVFQNWIDDESSERTLWCPGDRECYSLSVCILLMCDKAGSGKTVITYVSLLLSTNCATEAYGRAGLSLLIICLITSQTRTQK